MNIYIDESGSINNHMKGNNFFVIAMVHVNDGIKLSRAYKRFISSNYDRLVELDQDKKSPSGKLLKSGGKMFQNGKFKELKGSQIDSDMKRAFINFFGEKRYFEVFYIVLKNQLLTDSFCKNTARAFNFAIKSALKHFVSKGYLPNESCMLQLDERNEKTKAKYFLENYLNTELVLSGIINGDISVQYFDSCNNKYVQIADVFANILWSEFKTNSYTKEIKALKEKGIIKGIYEFPYYNKDGKYQYKLRALH